MNFDKYKDYAPILVRIGMALVFLYFGISQLINPSGFVGWIPPEASFIPIQPFTLVVLNGLFEVFFGLLLLAGFYTRLSAFLLGAHLLGISFTIGFNQTGIRDFGLAIAALSVFLHGNDAWCLEKRFSRAQSRRGSSRRQA